MGKQTSNQAPESTCQIERYPDAPGWCDIVLYANPERTGPDGGYEYEVYRLTRRAYRDTLSVDVKAHLDAWLAVARQEEAAAALPDPTTDERMEQVEAALIELASIVTGGV